MRAGGELAVTVYGVPMYADGLIQPLLYGMSDSLQPPIAAAVLRLFSLTYVTRWVSFAVPGGVGLLRFLRREA